MTETSISCLSHASSWGPAWNPAMCPDRTQNGDLLACSTMLNPLSHSSPDSFLFYGQIIFYCMAISHFVFSSSVNGHWGCIQLLAIVNNTAINTHACFLWMLSFLLAMHLREELLGHMVTLGLTVRGTARLFSQHCSIHFLASFLENISKQISDLRSFH